jgi:SHS2 domain-containing protein
MPFKISDEHTSGDIKLTVSGNSLRELFSDAAIGITAIMTEVDTLSSDRKINVALDSDSLEHFLMDWMGEIIYLKDAERFLPVRVEFEDFNDTTFSMKAVLYGDTLDASRHPVKADIKAVTYYEFSLKKIGRQWIGEAVLDL